MVNIVALRLCGLLLRLKLIDFFVKVVLCADVRAIAQTTQPKSEPSRLPPRLECVPSRPRDEPIKPSRRRTSFRTFERYEQNVRIHIKSALGHIRVKDLRRNQIQDLYDASLNHLSPDPSTIFT